MPEPASKAATGTLDFAGILCESCEERQAIWFCDDPYLAELYPEDENPDTYWCEQCLDQRAGDI